MSIEWNDGCEVMKNVGKILTACSSGSRPRLSTSALLNLLASAATYHPRRHMQVGARSVYRRVLWIAPWRLVRRWLCCEKTRSDENLKWVSPNAASK
jgi:hypothetical protein